MKTIPDGYIEDADEYYVLSNIKGSTPILIGGRVMCNYVVYDQMDRRNIIATVGVKPTGCIVIVDYTVQQVNYFIDTAKKKIDKMVGSN